MGIINNIKTDKIKAIGQTHWITFNILIILHTSMFSIRINLFFSDTCKFVPWVLKHDLSTSKELDTVSVMICPVLGWLLKISQNTEM